MLLGKASVLASRALMAARLSSARLAESPREESKEVRCSMQLVEPGNGSVATMVYTCNNDHARPVLPTPIEVGLACTIGPLT